MSRILCWSVGVFLLLSCLYGQLPDTGREVTGRLEITWVKSRQELDRGTRERELVQTWRLTNVSSEPVVGPLLVFSATESPSVAAVPKGEGLRILADEPGVLAPGGSLEIEWRSRLDGRQPRSSQRVISAGREVDGTGLRVYEAPGETIR